MRRNFRRQSGMKGSLSRPIDRTVAIVCICERYTVDDITGESVYDPFPCWGTATAGVSNCSCCAEGRKPGVNQGIPSALTMG